MLLILPSYLAYEFAINKGYGERYDVTGSLRATVKANSPLSDIAAAYYCNQSTSTEVTPPVKQLPCMANDDLITTKISGLSLLIGTRLKTINQAKNDACEDVGCEAWLTESSSSAFIFDVSNSTILVQHSVAPAFEDTVGRDVVDAFQPRPPPKLIGTNGTATAFPCTAKNEPAETPDGMPDCPAAGDFFTVRSLLQVAGVDLDAPQPDDPRSTKRYDGLTMRVNVEYSGSQSYHYRLSYNKIEQNMNVVDYQNASYRLVYDLHGLKLNFEQTGYVVISDVRSVLLTIFSGLVMLSTAKTLADLYLLYIAPRRADYRLFVEQLTPDFGPDDEAQRVTLDKVLSRKRRERDELLGIDEPPRLLDGTQPPSDVAQVAVGTS